MYIELSIFINPFQADDVKALLRDAMMQEPSFSTPPTDHAQSHKSDIAYKGLTAAGASLLASEMVLGGDGKEGALTTGGRGTVGVALNQRGEAADGSDQKVTATKKNDGEYIQCCLCFVVTCLMLDDLLHVWQQN